MMPHLMTRTAPLRIAATALVVAGFGIVPLAAMTQERGPQGTDAKASCSLDLTQSGKMSDIVSNALMRGLDVAESDVRAFLEGAESRYATGQMLLEAAAAKFGLSESALAAEVETYRHCNCDHPPLTEGQITARKAGQGERWLPPEGPVEVSKFAKDVTLHVVLHELGHALIREFDLPVLGNEETIADAFATYYLTTYMPERAYDAIRARTASLMIEAREVPRAKWSVNGEHNSDARRAFQIAALAVAADPERYGPVATEVGLSKEDIRKATDYGSEIHRSWRRVLSTHWMPDGVLSSEARVVSDPDSEFIAELCKDGLVEELAAVLRRFDWHSQVTIDLTEGAGGAGWNRSKRTITVHSQYVQRFLTQGEVQREAQGESE